jgi:DNA-binding MarR family transcriptional regulator
MGERSSVEKMDKMLDDIYSIVPLFHRTILRVENQGHNPMSSGFKVMGILMRHGPLPMSKIGTWLGISKPNMTSIIDQLITECWVERKQDQKDRRVIEVGLTPQGKMYMEDRWKEARESARKKLSTLSEEERKTLYASLESVRVILSKLNEMKKQ